MSELEQAAAALVKAFTQKGLTFGTAESLTGGMISSAVAGIPGASSVLMGGVTSYDPRVKREVLGVSQAVIDGPGVVSRACAEEMAEGARRLLRVDVAVSATGVAGPSGGTEENPVGTAWLGLSTKEGASAARFRFSGDRQAVREQCATQALLSALSITTKE